MFRFEHPIYLILLVAIPVLVMLHYVTNLIRRRRLIKYGDKELLRALMPDVAHYRLELKFWFVAVAAALIIVCLAQPQYGTKVSTEKRLGIEAIIAIDVSNSMLARDVTPSRIDRAKMMMSNLIDHMTDDKVGLVVYAGDAFVQLPITNDYVSAKMFLDGISPAMIELQGTDIAEAINQSTRSFTSKDDVGRAVILITDGEDNEGGAVEAAAEAAKKGIHVYVLGIGSPDGSAIPDPDGNGYITDDDGQIVVSRLNEQMCQEIAQAGKGAYIYVDNSSSAQTALDKQLDKLAKGEFEDTRYDEYEEHFMDFAWLALILLLLDILMLPRKNGRFRNIHLFQRGTTAAMFIFALSIPATAQRTASRSFVHRGNQIYREGVEVAQDTLHIDGKEHKMQELFGRALVEYKKAVEADSTSAVALYNLGCAYMMTNQFKEAAESFQRADAYELNKQRKSKIYHNMGFLKQVAAMEALQQDSIQKQQKLLHEAIEFYKASLRRNPTDDETRYNMVLCQRQLKNDNQQQQQQQQ
ncbi:MAG: VWA domain-containing protein, partial [Bacteroidaceae bacterium]|nr:VWA domain-containing protein [Bacteroidaceae bacterium]